MADNVTLPGTGQSVATDDIGGNQYQRVKLIKGTEGVNDGDISDANPWPVKDQDAVFLLNRLLVALSSPQGYDRSLQRQRGTVVIESGTVTTVSTVTTCSTVSSVSNIAAIDGLQPRIQIYGANLSAWKDCVRSCIT